MSIRGPSTKVVLLNTEYNPFCITPAPKTLKSILQKAEFYFDIDIKDIELSYYTFRAMRQKRIMNDMEYKLWINESGGNAQISIDFKKKDQQQEIIQDYFDDLELEVMYRCRTTDTVESPPEADILIKPWQFDSNGPGPPVIEEHSIEYSDPLPDNASENSDTSKITSKNIELDLVPETEHELLKYGGLFMQGDLIKHLEIFSDEILPGEFLDEYGYDESFVDVLLQAKIIQEGKSKLYQGKEATLTSANIAIVEHIEKWLLKTFCFSKNDPLWYTRASRFEYWIPQFLKNFKTRQTVEFVTLQIKYAEFQLFVIGDEESSYKLLKDALSTAQSIDNEILQSKAHEAIGCFYLSKDKFKSAEGSFLQSLTIRENLYGIEHIKTAQSLFYLGSVAFGQENVDRALQLHKDAVKIIKEQSGAYSKKLAIYLQQLAEDYVCTCNIKKAQKTFIKALKIFEVHFSDKHPIILEIHLSLVKLYGDQADYPYALKHLTQAKEISAGLYNDDHHESIGQLKLEEGRILMQRGEIEAGKRAIVKAKDIFIENFGLCCEQSRQCDQILGQYKERTKRDSSCCNIF